VLVSATPEDASGLMPPSVVAVHSDVESASGTEVLAQAAAHIPALK